MFFNVEDGPFSSTSLCLCLLDLPAFNELNLMSISERKKNAWWKNAKSQTQLNQQSQNKTMACDPRILDRRSVRIDINTFISRALNEWLQLKILVHAIEWKIVIVHNLRSMYSHRTVIYLCLMKTNSYSWMSQIKQQSVHKLNDQRLLVVALF